jgi:hypothetical protein
MVMQVLTFDIEVFDGRRWSGEEGAAENMVFYIFNFTII